MNWDQVQGNWKQLKGKVQQQWGKVTDDDWDQIDGKREELAGRIQQRYGYAKEKADFENMFSDFNPEFYFMRLFDIEEALNLFAKEKNIDLIIAVHRQHSFFDRLFNRSGTTKKLSYQSEVPVLVVHE